MFSHDCSFVITTAITIMKATITASILAVIAVCLGPQAILALGQGQGGEPAAKLA